MKTMTCKQMGGPCDTKFTGNTADEVIKAMDAHLKNSDEAHKEASEVMQARWKDPASGMAWYTKTKSDFEALPEDN